MKEVRFKNYTPHDIKVRVRNGEGIITFPSKGIARLSTKEIPAEDFFIDEIFEKIPSVRIKYGEVEGLPAPEKDVVYIVSSMVFDNSDRTDIVSPDTGKTAIRNEKGQIQSVTRFKVK